jgi:hypothetical protein
MSVSGLRFINGTNYHILAPSSSILNNPGGGTPTVVMWASITTTSPAAQRNFFGKATGNHNWVGYINPAGVQAGWGLTSTVGALASVSWANLTTLGVVANKPLFWVFQNDVVTQANNRVMVGSLDRPASEATYTTQRIGTAGSHDDSASQLTIGNSSGGGTTNTLPGNIYTFQAFNRILSIDEIRKLQFEWIPNMTGCMVSYRTGANGTGGVLDESGNALHAALSATNPVPVGQYLSVY